MTSAPTQTSSGSTIQIEGKLAEADVERLLELLELVPTGVTVTVELSHTRSVELHALVRLHELILVSAERGHPVLLRGVTMAQARLVELAWRIAPGHALPH